MLLGLGVFRSLELYIGFQGYRGQDCFCGGGLGAWGTGI